MKYLMIIILAGTLSACATSGAPKRDGKTPCACLDQQYFQGKIYELSNV